MCAKQQMRDGRRLTELKNRSTEITNMKNKKENKTLDDMFQ